MFKKISLLSDFGGFHNSLGYFNVVLYYIYFFNSYQYKSYNSYIDETHLPILYAQSFILQYPHICTEEFQNNIGYCLKCLPLKRGNPFHICGERWEKVQEKHPPTIKKEKKQHCISFKRKKLWKPTHLLGSIIVIMSILEHLPNISHVHIKKTINK